MSSGSSRSLNRDSCLGLTGTRNERKQTAAVELGVEIGVSTNITSFSNELFVT